MMFSTISRKKNLFAILAASLILLVTGTTYVLPIINEVQAEEVDCAAAPSDPSCPVDCSANPSHPSCGGDPVDCNVTPEAPECFEAETCNDPADSCYCTENPDAPECFEAVDCEMDPDPSCENYCDVYWDDPECWDPCLDADPPEECEETNKYCYDASMCDGEPACNYSPEHVGEEGWEEDNSTCNCDCYEDTNYYCNEDGACNFDPGKAGLDNWEEDNSTCSYEYYCPDPNDPFYTDPGTLLCPRADNAYCQGIGVCNNASFCEGKQACNYEPELANTEGYRSDDSVCTCDPYCPDTNDANYQDPANMVCPRADWDACTDPEPGCPDEDAINYDPLTYPGDLSVCEYLNSNICSYEAQFSVQKINPNTSNLRTYQVGILYIEAVNIITNVKDAMAPCPTITEDTLTSAGYAYIYDLIYPSWPDFGVNTTYFTNLGESEEQEDMCPNLDGAQEEMPPGYVTSEGICITIDACVDQGCSVNEETDECDCIDMCPNIDEYQEEIPIGYYLNEGGACVTQEECELAGGEIIDGICREPQPGICADYHPNPSGGVPTGTLCEQGDATEPVNDDNEWVWSCQGSYGGADAECSAATLCSEDEQYCSTNPSGSQCIDEEECCDGFMRCGLLCRPYSPSGCGGGGIECDMTATPPLCTADAEVAVSVRVSPPVADIQTNLCGLSWTADTDPDSEVSCQLIANGNVINSFGPVTADTNYSQTIEPGEYTLSCVRESEEDGTDEEGNPMTYILRENDADAVKCAQNPNYIEF
jgi:hypothetical protein